MPNIRLLAHSHSIQDVNKLRMQRLLSCVDGRSARRVMTLERRRGIIRTLEHVVVGLQRSNITPPRISAYDRPFADTTVRFDQPQ